MAHASYRQIPSAIRNRDRFTGNSLSGGPLRPGEYVSKGRGNLTVPDNADYGIWSYATIIGYAIGPNLFVTSERFSVTTTRGQNLLRSLGAETVDP